MRALATMSRSSSRNSNRKSGMGTPKATLFSIVPTESVPDAAVVVKIPSNLPGRGAFGSLKKKRCMSPESENNRDLDKALEIVMADLDLTKDKSQPKDKSQSGSNSASTSRRSSNQQDTSRKSSILSYAKGGSGSRAASPASYGNLGPRHSSSNSHPSQRSSTISGSPRTIFIQFCYIHSSTASNSKPQNDQTGLKFKSKKIFKYRDQKVQEARRLLRSRSRHK